MINQYLIPKPSIQKVANVPVSSDPDKWEEDVFQYLEKDLPYLIPYVSNIDWEEGKYDVSTGNGYGELVGSVEGKSFKLPIIIKNSSLEPIDTWYLKGRRTILNEDKFNELTNSMDIAESSNIGTEETELKRRYLNTLYTSDSPFTGKFASERFNVLVDKDESLKTYLHNKLASKIEYIKDLSAKELDEKFASVVLDPTDEGVKATYYEQGSPKFSEMMDKTDGNYEKTASAVREHGTLAVKIGEAIPTAALNALNPKLEDLLGGVEALVAGTNEPLVGRRYVRVTPEGKEIGKMFLDPSTGNYSLASSFFSKKTRRNIPSNKTKDIKEVQVGDTVAIDIGDNKIIAPLEVRERTGFPDGKVRVRFAINGAENFSVLFSKEVQSMIEMSERDSMYDPMCKAYIAPFFDLVDCSQVIFLENKEFVGSDIINKQLIEKTEKLPNRHLANFYRKADKTYQMKIAGQVVGEYENDNHLKAGLMSLGCTDEASETYTEYLSKHAEELGVIGVYKERKSVIPVEHEGKIASFLSDVMTDERRIELIKAANIMAEQNDKLAYMDDDDESLDVILGLSLIDNDTVKRCVDKIPSFEQAVDDLADLLHKVRVGLPEVEEGAIRSAMVNLNEVVTGLKDLYVYRV